MCLRRYSRKDPPADGLGESCQNGARAGGSEPHGQAESVHCTGVNTWLGKKTWT